MSVDRHTGGQVAKKEDKDMLNIFNRKKQKTDKQTSTEIKAIKSDMQKASEQYEASRQQVLKNLELINNIL